MRVLDVLLFLLALPALVASGYLALLALASRRAPAPAPVTPRLRFALVVPAHDEEGGIARTVQSLLALAWPADLRRVVVVADNCSDQTAARAAAAGAVVWERRDAERRGKGYALELAFERLLAEGWADAAVVIDADTVASPHLLAAFAARLEAGAQAVQAEYGVQNPDASWRTELMRLALALFHVVRSRGRERLGVSCGLRGNGMCFSARLLREVPHRAFSLVEDLEYGIRLGEAGHRVHFAAEAHVLGEMVAGERASRSQRRRWEDGRRAMARTAGWPLLSRGLRRRDGVLLDLALDVLVPPLARLGGLVVAGVLGALALSAVLGAPAASLWAWGGALALLGLYLLRGWQLSGLGARGVLLLLWAPAYLVWKVWLALQRPAHAKGEWVRTARGGEPP